MQYRMLLTPSYVNIAKCFSNVRSIFSVNKLIPAKMTLIRLKERWYGCFSFMFTSLYSYEFHHPVDFKIVIVFLFFPILDYQLLFREMSQRSTFSLFRNADRTRLGGENRAYFFPW